MPEKKNILMNALWNIGYQKEENVGSPFGIFGSFL